MPVRESAVDGTENSEVGTIKSLLVKDGPFRTIEFGTAPHKNQQDGSGSVKCGCIVPNCSQPSGEFRRPDRRLEMTSLWFIGLGGIMLCRNRKEVPGEVISEITTVEDHAGFGYAVADIQRSEAHHHNRTLEIYTLVAGRLRVYIGSGVHELVRPGDTVEIPIGQTHWAESLGTTPARIVVTTIPPWSAEDHILERKHA